MMSVRHLTNGTQVRVRLHHMFLTAPKEVRHALAHWVKHPRSRKYGTLFKEFIVARNDEIRNVETRASLPVTRGNYYDLKEIFDELNQRYFENGIDVAISWGRDCGRNTRSIRFGGYYPNERLIRIHHASISLLYRCILFAILSIMKCCMLISGLSKPKVDVGVCIQECSSGWKWHFLTMNLLLPGSKTTIIFDAYCDVLAL